MSQTSLIALSVGPVQDFIAAARRTGDLTAGSDLLVYIAKAVAKAVEQEKGVLIFPADSDTDGPNKVLAELPEGVDPAQVARKAKQAAREALWQRWEENRQKIRFLDAALADAQIATFLEVYAAWVPVTEGYAAAREAVEGKLAARKNLREFAPAPPGMGRDKSPLDPALECVLTNLDALAGERPLFLKKTETLDALSLLKRLLGKQGQRETGGVPSTRDLAERRNTKGAFTEQVGDQEVEERAPSYPYFAILHADGDRMGELLEKQNTPEAHRALSRTLVAFCKEVRRIVEEHDGYLVYAGGDDVLAFLPVHLAIACADAIQAAFISVVDTTLSAGVAIVHYKEPLAHGLQRARDAEKVAKEGGRNRLCLAIHTRGGVPLELSQEWSYWPEFETWLSAFRENSLTRGVAYELRQLAQEFKGLSEDISPELLSYETQRIWDRKESVGTPPGLPDDCATTPAALETFAKTLIAARFLTQEGE